MLQLTAPGTPDVYQGDELWNLVLVDPDNRRAVDWRLRDLLLADAEREGDAVSWWRGALADALTAVGAPKLRLLHALLRERRRRPALHATGAYAEVGVAGARAGHVVATLRADGDAAGLAVAPRLALTVSPDGSAPVGEAAWGDTALALPAALAGRRLRDVVTGRVHDAPSDGRLRVADVLVAAPVALLIA